MDFNLIITFIACICFLFILGKLFLIPLKILGKILLNSILGGILIYLINFIGINFDFHIGLNFFTTIFIGILGIPGAIILIFLRLLI